jgi:pyrroloquinoline quinone biosynthesis protein B
VPTALAPLLASLIVAATPTIPAPRVEAIVLGIAQDAGVPQANCRCARCDRARRNPRHRHFASSLALLDLTDRKTWLVEATPDVREQLDLLAAHPLQPLREGRTPLDGVLLTHAHVGHYAGLIHFGREAMGSRGLPVHCTDRLASFLETNGPWSLAVELGHLALRRIEVERPFPLGAHVTVTALTVPHRDELSDTVAFVIRGPRRTLLWLPDIDKWEKWDRRLEDVLAGVDVALLDATFYSGGELPDRPLRDVPHPTVEETLARLAAWKPEVGARPRILLIHVNHSNPLLGPGRREARVVEAAGIEVATEGLRLDL